MASRSCSFSEESAICAICSEYWIDKDPRVLQCQHTFCFDCIKNLENFDSCIECPICGQKFYISKRKIGNLPKKSHSYRSVKRNEYIGRKFCQKHNQEGAIFCETHNKKYVCMRCLNEDHQGCKIQTMDNYTEQEKLTGRLIDSIDKKEKLVCREIDEKVEKAFKNFLIMKEKTNKLFENLRNEIINELTSYPVDGDKLQKLQQIIDKQRFAIIPDVNNLSYSFSIDFKRIKDSFIKFSLSMSENSFEESTKKINLPFKKIENIQFDTMKREFHNNFMSFSPSVFIKVKNEKLNIFETFLLKKHIFSRKDCDNLKRILQNNVKIKTIYIKRNLDMKDGFLNILNGFQQSYNTLVDIAIINCNLNENQSTNLGKLINNCGRIESINLSLNENMKAGLFHICNGLSKSVDYLKIINFSFCEIEEIQCKAIEKLLLKCNILEQVNLSYNQEMGYGFEIIFNALFSSSDSLRDINFSGCELQIKQCKSLAGLLCQCSKLEKINLQENGLMGKGFAFICQALENSSATLKYLGFYNSDLNASQAFNLVRLLAKCRNIETLLLGKCPDIMDRMDEIFCNLDRSREKITELDLSAYDIKNVELENYRYFFENCYKLEKITLEATVNNGKIFNMYDSFKNSVDTLKVINLKCCVQNSEMKNIEKLFRHCTNIEELNFNYIPFIFDVDSTFDFYRSLIRSKNSLKRINLDFPLDERSCNNLANLLRNCQNIEYIDFSVQGFSGNGSKNLSTALLKSYQNIKKFCLKETMYVDQVSDFMNFLIACPNLEVVSMPWEKSLRFALFTSASSLKELNFHGEFTEETCLEIKELIENCPNIELLCLGGILKSENGLVYIFKGLMKSSRSLKGLCLGIQDIDERQTNRIIELWKSCANATKRNLNLSFLFGSRVVFSQNPINRVPKSFTNLDFAKAGLTESKCKIIGELICHFYHIQHVDLSENHLMGNGLSYILDGLKHSSASLRNIELYETSLNEKQCIQLGQFLKNCNKLKGINICKNKTILSGFQDIFEGLMNSSNSLKVLKLGYCKDAKMMAKNQLVKLINSCSNLQEICIAEFKFDDEQFYKICKGLKNSCSTIITIDLCYCNLNEKQAYFIHDELLNFSTLKYVYLEGNNNMGYGLVDIIKLLRSFEYSMRKFDVKER